jgi:hypothetical protein
LILLHVIPSNTTLEQGALGGQQMLSFFETNSLSLK